MRAKWTDRRELTVDVSPRRRAVGHIAGPIVEVLVCLGAGLAAWAFVGRGIGGIIAGVLVTALFAAIFFLVLGPQARRPLPRLERTAVAMGLALSVAVALIAVGGPAFGVVLCGGSLVLGAAQAMR